MIRDSDALADASVQEYKPPHYEAADAVNSSISKPVSFVRHRQMQVAADFRLKGDGVPPYVLVRGTGWDASGAFQCRYPESIASADEDTVFASPMGVIYVHTSSPRLLPGFIAKLEVFFRYQCKLPDDGDVWNDIAGNSDNVVYVTLSQPNPSKLCETLLEIGCTSAAGDTQEKPAFFHIWSIATTSTSETGGNGIPRKE